MEIKSSLINHKDFVHVKQSLIEVSEKDHKEAFRVKALEYIDDTSSEGDNDFFFDMMPFIRFLDPSDEAIAYTTPDHLIYLNMPNQYVGENVRHWDFTYDHECLHQLWDTFAVGKKIQDNGYKYNHQLLNVASDCVINDYLSFYLHKEHSDGLITPEYIKEQFGIDYDRKVDTQFTLYLKLLEQEEKILKDDKVQQNMKEFDGKIKPKNVSKKDAPSPPPIPSEKHSDDFIKGWTDAIQDVLDKKVDPTKYNHKKEDNDYNKGYNEAIKNIKQGLEKGIELSDSPSNGSTGDLPNIPWDLPNDQKDSSSRSGESKEKNNKEDSSQKGEESKDNNTLEEAQKNADEAKDLADKVQKNVDEAKKNGDKDADKKQAAADKAKEAAQKAQEAADKAKEAKEDGDDKGEKKAAKEAKDALDKAKEAAQEAGVEKVDKASNDNDNNKNNQKPEQGHEHKDSAQQDEDLDQIRKEAEDIINKYKSKITGTFGKFIEKCKKSLTLNKSGLAETIRKGAASWNQQSWTYLNAFVKKKVFQKKRQYKSTYQKVKRGSGVVKMGDPITPGRKIKMEKLTINVAFYIDVSGSMSGCIQQVFKATYAICEALKKKFGKDEVVDEVTFKMHVFDTVMEEIPFGKSVGARGGTMNFDEIVTYINKHTKEFLINVILTDAGFEIDKNIVKDMIKDIDGMILFITNIDSDEMKEMSKKYPTQLFYVLADSYFTVDKL